MLDSNLLRAVIIFNDIDSDVTTFSEDIFVNVSDNFDLHESTIFSIANEAPKGGGVLRVGFQR